MILSTFLYQISPNIFVGQINPRFKKELLKHLSQIKDKEKAIVLYEDKNLIEGFALLFFNIESNYIDFDGLKFFKAL
jgi:hypothetical protein